MCARARVISQTDHVMSMYVGTLGMGHASRGRILPEMSTVVEPAISPDQVEFLAARVSQLNDCAYCACSDNLAHPFDSPSSERLRMVGGAEPPRGGLASSARCR